MYGVTEVAINRCMGSHQTNKDQNGNSIVATVTDVLPYFYVAVPRGFTDADLEPFRHYLNVSTVYFS